MYPDNHCVHMEWLKPAKKMREVACLYFRFQSNSMVYAQTQYDTVNHDPMPNSGERAFENNNKKKR